MKNNAFLYSPIVYSVGNSYQIVMSLRDTCMVWVTVGDKVFYDHSNGVLRSDAPVHRVQVPAELLDREKSYTVNVRTFIERKSYCSLTHRVEKKTFRFKPVPDGGEIVICHMADVHNMTELALKAYDRMTKAPDLLVLNGDVIENSDNTEHFNTVFEICDKVTHGKIPVVFSRGNHDLRGVAAEKFADYVANEQGRSYFQFRCGCIWGLVIDSGEDKPDHHIEYGHTVCCEAFRREEDEYISEVIEKAGYDLPRVRHKLIVTHKPLSFGYRAPFNIETELFSKWLHEIKEKISPELMLCGHMHYTGIYHPGCKEDKYGQPCPMILGSALDKKNGLFTLAQITLGDSGWDVQFIKSE